MGGFDAAAAEARSQGRQIDDAVLAARSMPNADGWEPPISFDEADLPPFPCEALPPPLREFVLTLAEASQTPPDMSALMSLAACATVAAKRAIVVVKEDYREPLNLYVAVMADSGDRKSQIYRAVVEPLRAHDKAERARMKPIIAAAEQRFRLSEKRLRAAEEAVVKAKSANERERAQLEAQDLAEQHVQLAVPAPPRLIADDATPEALTSLIAQQGGRMALLSSEGGIFDIMSRYTNGVPNLNVYLKGHTAEDLLVDRKGRPSETVEEAALTVGIMIQPRVFQALSERPVLRDAGLLARFLYALPRTRVGERVFNAHSLPLALRQRYASFIDSLFALNADGPQFEIPLSRAAFSAWCSFGEEVEPQLGEFGTLGTIKDWGSKLTGAVVRIAGLLTLAARAENPLLPLEVSERSFHAAATIGRYLIPHALAAFSALGANEVVEDAKMILRCVDRRGWQRFTRRDLHQSVRRQERFKDPENLDRPLKLLVDRQVLRPTEAPKKPGPGRPSSSSYDVNPLYRARRKASVAAALTA